jgi:hypothetical protein
MSSITCLSLYFFCIRIGKRLVACTSLLSVMFIDEEEEMDAVLSFVFNEKFDIGFFICI